MMQPDAPTAGPQQGQPTGVNATLFTQDQVNHFAAEAKRTAAGNFFKDLGLDGTPSVEEMKKVFEKASKHDELENGQKGDVERISGELATARETAGQVPGLKEQLRRAELAGDEGLKPRYWKYVEGKTDEEIKASITAIKADIGSGGSEGGEQQGEQGSGLTSNPQQGANGGGTPKKTLSSGQDAYKKRHNKE